MLIYSAIQDPFGGILRELSEMTYLSVLLYHSHAASFRKVHQTRCGIPLIPCHLPYSSVHVLYALYALCEGFQLCRAVKLLAMVSSPYFFEDLLANARMNTDRSECIPEENYRIETGG